MKLNKKQSFRHCGFIVCSSKALFGLALASSSCGGHAQAAPKSPTSTAVSNQETSTIHGNQSLEFEAASVRPDKSKVRPRSNVSLTSSDEFQPTGGLFDAVNISVISYIAFAYKLTNKQLQEVVSQVPWTASEPFDIQGRAAGNPTKDDFRMMMQALLRDRFKFRAHFEAKEVPVYGLMFVKQDKWGPQLRLHTINDPVCNGGEPTANTEDAQYPKTCNGISGMQPSQPGRMKSGARGISMTLFANIMSGVGVTGRPLINETGLTPPVDFVLEWQKVPANFAPNDKPVFDETAPSFQEALREQLGLKMVAHNGLVQEFVVDHIEHPDPN